MVRAFHNICRHRGSRVVAAEKGSCKNALVCPFHGWVYNLDGTLRGAARPRSFPELDKTEFGLMPLDLEIWQGFIFIRFRKGPQPSVAELMKPFEEEISHYDIAEMVPAGASGRSARRSTGSRCATSTTRATTWRWRIRRCRTSTARPISTSPSSTACRAPSPPTIRMPAAAGACATTSRSRLSPAHLPEYLRRAWLYYGLFPNGALALTPESVQFYQEFPLSTGETLLRGAVYRYPEESRRQRLARYLAMRIDRETQEEDIQLTVWSNESMLSNAFAGFFLSDLEYGVRTHHDHLRGWCRCSTLEAAPDEKDIWALNDALRSRG